MFEWLYNIFVSFVTMVLAFFGIDLKKKTVTFAAATDDVMAAGATEPKEAIEPIEPIEPIDAKE
jgi:hypothetical protein